MKKRYLTKAYEVTLMSILLKTATKEGTVKNAGKIFDGLVKALDDLISVSGTKIYNEIYEDFATRESFGMLFNTEIVDMASYYSQKSGRVEE